MTNEEYYQPDNKAELAAIAFAKWWESKVNHFTEHHWGDYTIQELYQIWLKQAAE